VARQRQPSASTFFEPPPSPPKGCSSGSQPPEWCSDETKNKLQSREESLRAADKHSIQQGLLLRRPASWPRTWPAWLHKPAQVAGSGGGIRKAQVRSPMQCLSCTCSCCASPDLDGNCADIGHKRPAVCSSNGPLHNACPERGGVTQNQPHRAADHPAPATLLQ